MHYRDAASDRPSRILYATGALDAGGMDRMEVSAVVVSIDYKGNLE